ncbi:hypothetical protein [Vibrio sagamiensis]|nr:hypothetical protein [Vibrio sagamiensis]PNQ58951.1 hypothetical protein C1141_12740 [Vibrio agarivorans]
MNNYRLHSFLLLSSLALSGCSSIGSLFSSDSTHDGIKSVKSADAASIATWVDNSILMPVGLSVKDDNPRYLTGSADLNHDGSAEHIVLMQEPYFCGSGGCVAYIFDNVGHVINRMTITRTPILIAETRSNGWQDFIVWSNGAYRKMSFNGQSYPNNPSTQPTVIRETSAAIANVMATEVYQQDGYDIMPLDQTMLWTPDYVYHFTFKHHGEPQSLYHATVNMKTNHVDIESTPK